MRRFPFFAIFSLFLTACVTQTASFSVPEKIVFEQQSFEKVTHNQLDEMQQLLYLPSSASKNPNNWQKGILIFLDQNRQGKTLAERAELRKQHFARQHLRSATVEIQHNELTSQVIYPPSERFNDVMLETSRGRDLSCGFGQMQLADKRAVSGKKLQNTATYQTELNRLARLFGLLAWQIECK